MKTYLSNDCKREYFAILLTMHFAFVMNEMTQLRFILLLFLDVCSLALLNNHDRKLISVMMVSIIVASGVSRFAFVWFMRVLALITVSSISILGVLEHILQPDLFESIILFLGGIFYFAYIFWIVDVTQPIDRRIIACFTPKK